MKTILTITGPSLSGKSTLESLLVKEGFTSVISTTTREPRPYEVHGQHYYFISKEEFKELDQNHGFIESIIFNDDHYGVSVEEIDRLQEQNKPIVIVVEPVGKNQINLWCRLNNFYHISVFMSCDDKIMSERFIKRYVQDLILKSSDVDRDLKIATKRLTNLLTKEKQWIEDAYNDQTHYSYFISNIDQDSELSIVQDLITLTTNLKD